MGGAGGRRRCRPSRDEIRELIRSAACPAATNAKAKAHARHLRHEGLSRDPNACAKYGYRGNKATLFSSPPLQYLARSKPSACVPSIICRAIFGLVDWAMLRFREAWDRRLNHGKEGQGRPV